MANRREFLQGSVAASMLVLSPGLRAAIDTVNRPDHPSLYKVLFDARNGASLRFADAFAMQGIATLDLRNGDITPFWRNELSAVWARTPAAIAGLTDASVLFCLEQLGLQYGLRVLHRETREAGLLAWVVAPRHLARTLPDSGPADDSAAPSRRRAEPSAFQLNDNDEMQS